jgi:hypothetical protein
MMNGACCVWEKLYHEQAKRTRSFALCNDVLLLLEHFRHPGFSKAHRAIRWKLVWMVSLTGAYLTDLADGATSYMGVPARNMFLLHTKAEGTHCLATDKKEDKGAIMSFLESTIVEHNRYAQ